MLEGVKRTVHKLFGAGTSTTTRKRAYTLDEIGPDNMPEGALAALYDVMDSRYPETKRRIKDSIDLRAGKKRAFMHANWSMDDRENLRADGPEKYEEPSRLKRRLGSRKSRMKRPASGIEPKAQRESTRIEAWDNGYLDEVYDDIAVTDLLLNEAETLILQMPAPSHWECIPTLYDEWEEEGKHVTQDDYDKVPENRRREYEPATSSDDAPTYKRMRKRYRVNKDGEGDDGSESFETDVAKSTKYYRDEMEDAFARNIPIIMRGPISRLDFVPINPVFSGKGIDVDGVIIRSLYRKAKLKREYKWDGADNRELLEAVTAYDGIDGDFYLYELWAYDELHRPYVAYQVGTKETSWADDDQQGTAVVKLWEEYPGVTELPIAFDYGPHNAGSNADLRTLPYTTSKQQNWLQRDGVLTALAISTAESGYPTWGQKITKDGIEAMRMLGGDLPLEFVMQPNAVQPIIGDLIELTSKGTNNDVKILLQALGALNESVEASPGAFGGEGPTSGLDRQVLGRDLEIAHGDVIEGGRRIKEKCGRHALMLGSAIGKKADRPVELYVMTDATLPQGGGSTKKRERVSLPPDLCGGNWDVIAEFPHQPGEDLAGSSLLLEMLKSGAILMREWREIGWGDANPEEFMYEKALEDYFLHNPAGQLDVLVGMAEYIRDTRLKKMLELQASGQITDANGGFSVAAMDDLLGGGQQQPPPQQGMAAPQQGGMASMPGMQLPNPGQSALAGGIGGAMQASAASAGGPFDAMAR